MNAYEFLGSRYDDLVGDPDATQEWVDWIEENQPGPRFLELGCGSGEITRSLAENHQVDGLDLSRAMLDAARKKDPDGTVNWIEGDMRDLSGLGQYDAIGCFCDSFNYLIEDQEVRDFFDTVASHLVEGGLFLFDSHGPSRLEEFADDYEEAGTFEDGTQVQWMISVNEEELYQDFAFYLPDGRTIEEHHLQRVYPIEQLKTWLEKNFEVESIMGDFGEESLETCEKVFFVCRKKTKNSGKEEEK